MEFHTKNCTRPLNRQESALDVLHVCRQVYQETVLRPFRQTIFTQVKGYKPYYNSLPGFLDALVPAQAKAISHVEIVCCGSNFQTATAIRQLKGLKHLELLVKSDAWHAESAMAYLPKEYGIEVLGELETCVQCVWL